MPRKESAYRKAGVDIDAANRIKQNISTLAKISHSRAVLKGIGHFGGFFKLGNTTDTVLVGSTDSVGTKLTIASTLDRHDGVGFDIVNHCLNDILCCGAEPLFFLDYIAMAKLSPGIIESVIKGVSEACRQASCSLVGGETAELSGIYAGNAYDLVGFMVGRVAEKNIIDGSKIREGDLALGLPSSGLHTNGYTLARRVFNTEENPAVLKKYRTRLGMTLGDALLTPHRAYYPRLKPALPFIKGLAHITGGGLLENPPRVIPAGLSLVINKDSWPVPPIFGLMQEVGDVSEKEMYRVFNMGVGMVVIVSTADEIKLRSILPEATVIGRITRSRGNSRVTIT